jgi:hypothetical protein
VKTPEEALGEARRRAAERRPAAGALPEDGPQETQQDSLRRLATWAMIEPDEAEVYSTRAWGYPVTLVKRLLIRLLRQYLVQMTAQQSRFNAHMVSHLIALDERVSRLEELAGSRPDGPAPVGPPTPGGTEASSQ